MRKIGKGPKSDTGLSGSRVVAGNAIRGTNIFLNSYSIFPARFDFKVDMAHPDVPVEQRISAEIVRNWFREKPKYWGEELRAYLDWTKPYIPDLSDAVRAKAEHIIYNYIVMDEKVRGSMRKKETIMRVAYALAKANHRAMQINDFFQAIRLTNPQFDEAKLQILKRSVGINGDVP